MLISGLTGAILAGGAASRFGGAPKGLERLDGSRLIDRVADGIRPLVDELLVVSNDPAAASWLPNARVVRDRLPGRASLIGIHSAVAAAAGDVLVAAWDMPFVPRELLAYLAASRAADALAVIPEGPAGPEPCLAIYSPAALPHIERLIGEGSLRAGALATALPHVVRIPLADVARFGDPARMFTNVNTRDDLLALDPES